MLGWASQYFGYKGSTGAERMEDEDYVRSSASFLAEISVKSPRKLFIFITKKNIFSGSKYPRSNLFNFEKGSTGP